MTRSAPGRRSDRRRWRRIHALTTPLTDYLSYECEWAYTDNVAAGEDVRIIDNASDTLLAIGDFFVIDHQYVIRSHYDKAGLFVGAEVIWHTAQPFTEWWHHHPNTTATGQAERTMPRRGH